MRGLSPPAGLLDAAAAYYADQAVRARIREYCGGEPPGASVSCAFVTGLSPLPGPEQRWDCAEPSPPTDLDRLLDNGDDVARSVWDTASLLVALDIDYLNADIPGEGFVHPADTFLKLEPTCRAAQVILRRLGLAMRCLMTGRGYHFVGRVPLSHAIVDDLASLARQAPAWFASVAARRPPWQRTPLPERQARAHGGLGMVVEHLAHLVLQRAAARSPVPVVLNGTIVGNATLAGRECVSIDISSFGDPLDVRHLRAAFSTYQVHVHRPDVYGWEVALSIPPLVALPRDEPLVRMLVRGRTTAVAARRAQLTAASIPDVTGGIARLLASYRASPLRAFHDCFDEALAREPAAEDRVPGDVPRCVAEPLKHPNDLLLKPAQLQHVTRALLSRGWAPARVARIVQACYTREGTWGDRWRRLDPETRAAFDVRVFAGLVATGADRLVDFNCASAQEKGLCPREPCTHDLRRDRQRLLAGAVS